MSVNVTRLISGHINKYLDHPRPTPTQDTLWIAASSVAGASPLVLSRVHWVEPKLVAEITYLTWTSGGLLRHTVYVGLREDKPATDVRRES
jgi:ATP-dependent DNA ligase